VKAPPCWRNVWRSIANWTGRANAWARTLFEDRRGPDGQPLPRAARPVPERGDPSRASGQLYPPGNSGHRRQQVAGVAGRRGTDAVPAGPATDRAVQEAHARQEGRGTAGHAGRDGSVGQQGVPATARRRFEIRVGDQREGRADRVGQFHLDATAAFAQTQRAPHRVPAVLPAVPSPRKHAGRDAQRLDPDRCLLRQGPRLREFAGRRAVSGQRAGQCLRELDRRRTRPVARRPPLFRSAPPQDAIEGHPPLRHLRAHPERSLGAAHVERGGVERGQSTGAAGQRILRRARKGLEGPLVRPLPETAASRAVRSVAARSTPIRTS
jgi:hypothetical protein